MQPFEFVVADSPASARALVREVDGARYYAGGTTLVDLMKGGVETPPRVVDISHLALAGVTLRPDGVRIGALARNSDVANDATIAARFPALAQALLSGASGQIRNAATIGGNLLQRTRCSYFRETRWNCNKRIPGSGCDALAGFNRGHAVLGANDACIATYPGDMAVALSALSAHVVVEGDGGERTIAIDDLFLLPGDTPQHEHALAHGDLIVAVELRFAAAHERSQYLKVRDRASYEFALVSAACGVELAGGTIRSARLALGGVATVPWHVPEAEDALAGAAPGAEAFRHAAELALAGAVPRAHNAFKIELAKRAIVRVLESVCGGAA
ncbi:FAD-binding molybdopterin dehydrogenase [Vulcanimicrobium alpinum]|uniref:FAD-binding molybdopterin dehydrogenase n=1 Tax=Vulcanimicrobium alpinum TaxID=3016050 RepID=A0AAN1XUP0_UNVUL|nr:xanthine dehydrogenase family protein subunit M [Vulcanimicrobium alpinum]BDE05335.1 FAD-binding molybdopterin dehydrogenase [Vulcanimicrobium alpinum]